MSRLIQVLSISALALFASAQAQDAHAKPKKKAQKAKVDAADEKAFKDRLAALKKNNTEEMVVTMLPGDDPMKVPDTMGHGPAEGGFALVASQRTLYTPETLDPGDMYQVLKGNLIDVRKCYKKQLAEDPEWNDEFILDISVKKTGRVSEVSISPKRVRRDTVGQCLMSVVPKWKFPKFTGESDDGVTQEVVNASFPIQLAPP